MRSVALPVAPKTPKNPDFTLSVHQSVLRKMLVALTGMETISARKRADGSTAYTAQIRLKDQGVIVHTEAQTFTTKALPQAQRASGSVNQGKSTVDDLLDAYVKPSAGITEWVNAVGQIHEGGYCTAAASGLATTNAYLLSAVDMIILMPPCLAPSRQWWPQMLPRWRCCRSRTVPSQPSESADCRRTKGKSFGRIEVWERGRLYEVFQRQNLAFKAASALPERCTPKANQRWCR